MGLPRKEELRPPLSEEAGVWLRGGMGDRESHPTPVSHGSLASHPELQAEGISELCLELGHFKQ